MPPNILIFPKVIECDHDWIVRSVQGSYWGGTFTRPQILAALKESAVWGAYLPSKGHPQVPGDIIGFVRAVSDHHIWSSITDVLVAEDWRGKGVGSALMSAVVADPRIGRTMCILQARPEAQLWYMKWDFKVIDPVAGIMQRLPSK